MNTLKITRHIFNLKNVKTYPYRYYYAEDVKRIGGQRVRQTYIDYGNFQVKMEICQDKHEETYFYFATDINWIHPASRFVGKKMLYNNLCLGSEYGNQIYDIINTGGRYKRKSIEHILNDYFSTCTEAHWVNAGIPRDLEFITNDDLFMCQHSRKIHYKTLKSKKFLHASSYNDSSLSQIVDLTDVTKFPVDLSNFIFCDYCGYISKPESKTCHHCQNKTKQTYTVAVRFHYA